MLATAANYCFGNWVNGCLETMLDEVVVKAESSFSIGFKSNTAKVYFYVLVNKTLLFDENFQVNLTATALKGKQEELKNAFAAKKVT